MTYETPILRLGITGLPPKAHTYTYLFGPAIFAPKGRYRPFAHALFGQNNVGTNLSNVKVNGIAISGLTTSDTSFAMAFGGGVDVVLTDRIALRAGQVDYLYTKHDFSGGSPSVASHQNNLRACVGIVFQLGGMHHEAPHGVARPTAALSVPVLGVYVVPVEGGGARIVEISNNSAAELAGLQQRDVINAVNGSPVNGASELVNALSNIPAGSKVRLGYAIKGTWQSEVTVILGTP